MKSQKRSNKKSSSYVRFVIPTLDKDNHLTYIPLDEVDDFIKNPEHNCSDECNKSNKNSRLNKVKKILKTSKYTKI